MKEQAEYGYGVFANSLSPSEICDLLNEQQATINKLKSDIEETEISIKLFEDDVNRLYENIIMKNKIEDLRVSLFMQDKELQRQMQKSDLDE